MFLLIENDGVCPIEGFTILGLSTARGNKNVIGQFGSGAKHGVLTCLRSNINPIIYLGQNELKFSTQDAKMGDKNYKRVIYSFNGESKELSMALEFGALDWQSVEMGFREFISNALDSVELDASKIAVTLVNNHESCENKTRIYLPAVPEVIKFYGLLKDRFLHFRENYHKDDFILEKESDGPAKIFRQGVFVRESKRNALFDYNLPVEVKIDESRNMEEYTISSYVGMLYSRASVENLKKIFRHLDKLTAFEKDLPYYSLQPASLKDKENWRNAFYEVYGNQAVIYIKEMRDYANKASAKGYTPVEVQGGWYEALLTTGVRTASMVTTKQIDKNKAAVEPSLLLTSNVRKIWNKLEEAHLTNGKKEPKVMSFEKIMEGGEETGGFYKDGVIYILRGYENSVNTILEEIAHHITGASDCTRDFQDYAFRCAATFMDIN
jgi:hypothetical protein